jgi:hypothetical protein
MRKIRVDHVAALLLLLACTGFFLWRAKHGMRFNTFGDETMHFIGAKALLSGKILYRDYIELHGPLAYAIPQGFFWIFGWGEPLHARAILIVLTAIAALSVGGSPCLGDMWERMVAAAFFLGMITTLWIVQGLCLYNYQPPAGAFMVIALALTVFPSWLDVFPRAAVTFLAGCCLALTPFLAFSYGPAAILFFTSAVWAQWAGGQRRQAGAMMAGAAAGVFLMVCWILRFADLRGYFVFHFIHALVDFGPYLHFGLLPAIEVLWIHTAAKDLPQAMGVIAATAGFLALLASDVARRRHFVPVIIGLAGVIATNSRASSGFQDDTFLFVSFGLLSLSTPLLFRRTLGTVPWARAWAVSLPALVIVGAEFTARAAISSPQGFTRRQIREQPPASLMQSDAPWARDTRTVTAPDEPILAIPFEPDIYALAGRMPMDRYIYYLPWDADYARHPWLGIKRDLCLDIVRTPPPMIYYNGWVVWNKWDPQHYIACLLPILAAQYRPMPGEKNFYVRLDRVNRLAP